LWAAARGAPKVAAASFDNSEVNDHGPSTTAHEIKTLILSFQPVIAIETAEEERVDRILESVAHRLSLPLFEWTVTRGLRRREQPTPFHGTNQPLILLKYIAGLSIEAIFHLKDFVPHLEGAEVRRQFRELAGAFSGKRSTLVISGGAVKLPPDLSHLAVHYRLKFPSHEELREVVREQLQDLRAQHPFRIDLGPDGLEELLRALSGLTLKQARQVLAYCILEDGRLGVDDIGRIIERKGEAIREQGLLEYYPVSLNAYELGGFKSLRGWLDRARVGFSKKAREFNLSPPKGLLLVGVQGCGKSLAAKYVAKHWRLPLLKLDAGCLFDKYVGESEKNFRRATGQAESMAPVVLWIDEIEKSFASGGNGDADGGLGKRILGAFLTWLQEKNDEVFVVATANDLSALPPELLRKGRFDEIFFVDLPGQAERASIFEIHLKLRNQSPGNFDLPQLAAETEGFSGAEIEQVVITALYRALHSQTSLTTKILVGEANSTVPLSVSRREEIEKLRSWARQRFVSAN